MTSITMIGDIAQKVLSPYARNHNTGNKYEIQIIFHILRKMGLTNDMLDGLTPLMASIKARNSRYGAATYIDAVTTHCRTLPVGTEFILDSRRIVDLRNTTQDDGDGKTADLIAIMDSGTQLGISICGAGAGRKDSRVEKCLSNPSAARLGATKADITAIKALQAQAVTDYKAYMTAMYGASEAAWPDRLKTDVAVTAATGAARITADRFTTLPDEQKIAIFRDLLRIDEVSTKPADYLACAADVKTQVFYKFGDPVFPHWAPRVVADGIWLHMYNCDTVIGRIQVKFNNGVYHKGKTSSLCSSWNFTVNLRDIFALEPAPLM
jgi:hypothetical protein